MAKLPQLPKHLTPASRRWARGVLQRWALEDHQVKVLVQAAAQLDRIEQAREQLAKDGPYVEDRWHCVKSHPALRDERDGRVTFARLVRELNLSEQPEDPRPPALGYK